jgi:hypothetical protein
MLAQDGFEEEQLGVVGTDGLALQAGLQGQVGTALRQLAITNPKS